MTLCIGIGFIILCLALLVFVVALFNYTIHLTKEELDVNLSKPHQVPNLGD